MVITQSGVRLTAPLEQMVLAKLWAQVALHNVKTYLANLASPKNVDRVKSLCVFPMSQARTEGEVLKDTVHMCKYVPSLNQSTPTG